MARRIPQQQIDRIVERVSLADVIGDYVKLRRQGARLVGLCPFHDEKTPSFHVNEDRGFYHCFGCGASGNAPRFLMEHDGLSFREAMEDLARRAGETISLEADGGPVGPDRDERQRYFEATEFAMEYFRRNLQSGRHERANAYLEERGIDEETARSFGLGYASRRWDGLLEAAVRAGFGAEDLEAAGLVLARERGDGWYDRFRGRVMFPIADLSRRVLAFSGRTLDPEERAKYINSPETAFYTKGKTLFGLQQAQRAIREREVAILVEGNFDVVALHARGVTHVCAALGTALTSDQARLLHRFTERVVLLYDGDRAGRAAADKALEQLLIEDIPEVRLAQLPEGVDPDDLVQREGREALDEVIERAKPMLELRLDEILAPAVGVRDRGVRRRAADEAGALLRQVSNPLVYGSLLRETARRLQVDAPTMERYIRSAASRRGTRAEAESSARERPAEKLPPLSTHEAMLVEVLADEPTLLGRVYREELHHVIEHDALADFVEDAARAWTEDGASGLRAALDALAQADPLRELISAALARGARVPEGQSERCYQEAADQLKRRWLQQELLRVTERIRMAEGEGDMEQALDHAARLQDLQQLIETLDPHRAQP